MNYRAAPLLTLLALGVVVLLMTTEGSSDPAPGSDGPNGLVTDREAGPFGPSGLTDRFLPGEVRHLRIDIEQEGVEKLIAKRDHAFEVRYLFTEVDDYVPAEVQLDDEKVKARVRLKGDFIDHIEGLKWSFRVKVRGDHTLSGMKVFSIHHPKMRKYLDEWLYHQMLAHEEVLSLRYEFVKVTVNGSYVGLYALEEHFEKRLVERGRRQEGPIFKLDEGPLWESFRDRTKETDDTGIFLSTEIVPFEKKNTQEALQQHAYFVKGAELLDRFRSGELTTSEVFDTDALARYYAVSHVLGATHGTRWHNMRFYYNPVTSKLEPIGFGGLPRELRSGRGIFAENKFFDHFNKLVFSDVEFFAKYQHAFGRVAQRARMTSFLEGIQAEYERIKAVLQKEFTDYEHSLEYVHSNRRFQRNALESFDGFEVFRLGSDDREIGVAYLNEAAVPLQVIALSDGETRVEPGYQQIVFPRAREDDPHAYVASYDLSATGPLGEDVHVVFRVLGSETVHTKPLRRDRDRPDDDWLLEGWPARAKVSAITASFERDLMRRPPNAQAFSFLRVDDEEREITFAPGTWDVEQNMILPAGYRVVVPAGTHLRLSRSANFLSFSPVDFQGTSKAPIRVEAPDLPDTGQGLAVIGAGGMSTVEHTVFTNLTNPSHKGWQLTGAVSFYESPVELTNCQFVNSRCEDSVNLIRSSFSMTGCRFESAHADALDLDFSDGSIRATTFNGSGNDGIDVSGSKVDMADVAFRSIGDKGISAGEGSVVDLIDVSIDGCQIGIASKDRSLVRASRIEIRRARIGLAAYQKKPEFGPGRMELAAVKLHDIDLKFMIEPESTIRIDGEVVRAGGRKKLDQIVKRVRDGAELN